MKGSMTPTRLRLILSLALVVLGAAAAGAFAYGYTQLQTFAAEGQRLADEARISESSLADLAHIQTQLRENGPIVKKVAKLASTSKEYTYQDKIVEDIDRLAKEAGLSVKNVTFTEAKATPTSSSAPAEGGTADPAASADTQTQAAPQPIVNTRTATVTLDNPVGYDKFLNFIHLIEQSLFRMQVSQVSLARDSGGSGGVTSQTLSIEVYVK